MHQAPAAAEAAARQPVGTSVAPAPPLWSPPHLLCRGGTQAAEISFPTKRHKTRSSASLVHQPSPLGQLQLCLTFLLLPRQSLARCVARKQQKQQ